MTSYWSPRANTKRGGFGPPRTGSTRYGGASSAMRRHEERIYDQARRADYIQLAPGVIVVWERQPWRVIETAERPLDLWGEEYEQRFANHIETWERRGHGERPERATWSERPVAVVIVPDGDPKAKPLHLIGPAYHSWTVLPEHYPLCIACGELPPCRHELAEDAADRHIARAEVLMDIPAGHCLGCGEAITSRMKAVRYPGPNLWRPDLGDDSAIFHARHECSGPRDRYREQWQAKGGEDPQTALSLDDPDRRTP